MRKSFAILSVVVFLIAMNTRTVCAAVYGSSARTVAHRRTTRSRGTSKAAKLRDDLHRNLDGKADGFISSWRWADSTFTLTIDPDHYAPNRFVVTAMAIRACSNPTASLCRNDSSCVM